MNTYRDAKGIMIAQLSSKTLSYIMDNSKDETILTVKNFKQRGKVKVLLFTCDMSVQINRFGDRLYFWKNSYIEL